MDTMKKTFKIAFATFSIVGLLPVSESYAASKQPLKVNTIYEKAGIVSGSTRKGSNISIKKSGKTIKKFIVNKTTFNYKLSGLKSGQKITIISNFKNTSKQITLVTKKSPKPTIKISSAKVSGNYLVLTGKTDKNAQVIIKNGKKEVWNHVTTNGSYVLKINKNLLKSPDFYTSSTNKTTYGQNNIANKFNYKAPSISGVKNISVSKLHGFNPKSGITAKNSLGQKISFKITGSFDINRNGKYSLQYIATDAQGFAKKITRIVTVANTKPTITGVANTSIKKSAKTFDLQNGVQAQDSEGQKLAVKTSGTVNINKSGVYTIIYTATDKAGNTTLVQRQITVVNDIKPTISGVDNTSVTQSTKDFDSLAGVTAKDSDGNVLKVQVFGVVLTPFPGVYELTYIATDTSGNRLSVSRKVTVTEPVISGINNVTVNKSVGKFDPLSGVTAKDGAGNELDISVSGNVDMNKSGVYTLKYSVKGLFGDTITKNRTVTVKNDIKPTFIGIKDLTVPLGDPDGLVENAKKNVSSQDSDGQFVDMSMSGTVNVNKIGTYVLTYSGTDKDGNTAMATQKITVMIPETTGIQITGPQIVKVGNSAKLEATLTPTWNVGGNVTWTSGNNSIATVDANGNVRGVSSGSVEIFAEITDKNGKVWKTSHTVTVSDVIDASLYAYSQVSIGSYSRQVSVSLTNTDTRTMTVTRVQINDGSLWSADFSKDKLESSGIITMLKTGNVFSMSASSRVGWDLTNLNVIVTVQLSNGQTKDFKTQVK